MEQIEIRKAEYRDIDSIKLIAEITLKETEGGNLSARDLSDSISRDFSNFSNEISNPNYIFHVVEVEKSIIGYSKVEILQKKKYGEICKIYLLQKYQGNGYGKRLLRVTENSIIRLRLNEVHLLVWTRNSTISFYKKYGYRIIGTKLAFKIKGKLKGYNYKMVKKINEQIEYRKASKEDVSAVLEVEKVNYGDEALSIIYIKDCLEMYSDSFYVALINNKIVGFCIGLSSRSEEKGWISALNTLKGYEGKGIGSTLTKIIVAKLESLGSKSVRLTAKHDMVSFYENLDFQISGEKREDYYGFGEDRFYMKKNTEKI